MKKYINNIIIFSVFFVPLSSLIAIKGAVIWYPQLLALITIGFISLALLFWETNVFISLFLIYATLSYLLVCNQSPRSMLCLITGFCAILFSYFVSKSNVPSIYKCLMIISGLSIFLLVLQILKLDPIFIPDTNLLLDRTVGFVGSRNQLGIFHAATAVLMLGISPWVILLSLPILLVKCSSAFAGLMAGIVAYSFFIGRKVQAWMLIIILLFSVPIFIHFKPELKSELQERCSLWNLTINQLVNGKLHQENEDNLNLHRDISCNPFFGFGIGNFFVFSPMAQYPLWPRGTHACRWEHAHNDLVEALFEFGYCGLLLILLCISKVIADFINCINKTKKLIITFCGLICLSVCSMGVYVFHAPVSLFLFCLNLGLFYAEVANAKQSKIT